MYNLILLILLLGSNFNNNFLFLLLILILNNRNNCNPCSSRKQKNNTNNKSKVNVTNLNNKNNYTDIPFDYMKNISKDAAEESTFEYDSATKPYSNDEFDSYEYMDTLNKDQVNCYKDSKEYNDEYMNIAYGYPDDFYTDYETDNLKNLSEETLVNSDPIIKSNTEETTVNSDPIAKPNTEETTVNSYPIAESNTEEITVNYNYTTNSNTEYKNFKNSCTENTTVGSKQLASLLNKNYRGTTVSIIVSNLGVITGNIIFNFEPVIALKLKNNITVFINKNLVSSFF